LPINLLFLNCQVARSFSISKYEQFLTKHNLLSYNPEEYPRWNKIDFIRATLVEIDNRLFLELDNKNILSDETKDALTQEEVVFEKLAEIRRDSVIQKQKPQPVSAQKINSSQININGNVIGSTIIIGNENELQNLQKKK
jgi:hypothetical protein